MHSINWKNKRSRSRSHAGTVRSVLKKGVTLYLGLALLLACVPWNAAASASPSFPSQEVASVLNGQADRVLTQAELKQEFLSAGFQRYPQVTATGTATVRDLLTAFTYALDGQFCTAKNTTFVYPAGNSIWLSSSEWTSLIDSLDQSVTISTVRVLLNRTKKAQTFLSSHTTISTYRSYQEMIDAFFPEFSQLTSSNQDAIQFWLRASSNAADFSAVLHECAHEQSARLSGVFAGRSISSDGLWWGINWSKFPERMYFYDMQQQTWVSLETTTSLPSTWLLDAAPKDVKTSTLYQKYMGADSTANIYGIYGMLQELCSTVIDLRTEAVSTSLQSSTSTESQFAHLRHYYWWKGAVVHYLKALETERPKLYESMMQDEHFTKLLYDTLLYGDTQVSFSKTTVPTDTETLVMKAYAEELNWKVILSTVK
jgi:hypothetical protein